MIFAAALWKYDAGITIYFPVSENVHEPLYRRSLTFPTYATTIIR